MFKKLSSIYSGWWLVVTGGIIGFLGIGFTSAFSVMFKTIAAELGLSRAVTSIAASIQYGGGAILGPLGGIGSDKYGPRRIIIIGIFIAAAGCFTMYFVHSLPLFLIAWGVLIGAGIQLGFTFLIDRAIVNWFVKKSGLATNLKFAIQNMSGIIMLPFVAWLITNHGWRSTYIISGIAFLLVCLPLAWFFIKPHRPEYYGLLPDGESPIELTGTMNRVIDETTNENLPEFTLRQTIKTSTYWLYIIICCIFLFALPMIRVHLIPFLTDRGIDLVQAASMMGMMPTIAIPMRLLGGYVVDRIKTAHLRFIFMLAFLLQLTSVILFLTLHNTFSIYLWLILYSIGFEVLQGVCFAFLVRCYGRKAFGSLIGLSFTIQVPFMALAPVYIGWIYDTTGSYMNFLSLMAILSAAAGIISFFLFPPKAPTPASETVGLGS